MANSNVEAFNALKMNVNRELNEMDDAMDDNMCVARWYEMYKKFVPTMYDEIFEKYKREVTLDDILYYCEHAWDLKDNKIFKIITIDKQYQLLNIREILKTIETILMLEGIENDDFDYSVFEDDDSENEDTSEDEDFVCECCIQLKKIN